MTATTCQVAAGTTFIAGAAVLAYISFRLFHKKNKIVIPTDWEEIGNLTELNLYPLKSGKLIHLEKAECTEVGIKQMKNSENSFQLRDRCLVVYTANNNEFKSARTYPQLLHIDVTVTDADHIAIDAPNMETLYVKIPTKFTNKERPITLHRGEVIYSIDCGDEAAVWFSRYIKKKDEGLRLGYHDASQRRDITKTHKHLFGYYKNFTNFSTGLYQDFTSMSLINKPSVDDLVKKITDTNITVHHFRPNLIIDGPNIEPYSEDNWEWIKIGNVIMRNIKDCTRCMMVTLDPITAVRNTNREPLKTLEKYRISEGPSKLPIMGIHLEVRQSGILKVGDKVFVSRRHYKL